MFDPQKADPVFLEIVKRMPKEAVEVLGQAMRLLIAGDFNQAHAVILAGRRNTAPTEAAQKPLAALQQNVLVHNRLHELGAPLPVDRIWTPAPPQAAMPAQETTVAHDTQKALLDEARHQIARGSGGTVPCPACGSGDAAPIGRALLVRHDDATATPDHKLRALSRFLDPKPLTDILRMDISNSTANAATTLRIMLLLATREGLSVPVAQCPGCSLTFVAYRLREPEAFEPTAMSSYDGGDGTTFLSAYEKVLLPHFTWSESDLWAGASIYEFGCGTGASLAHHAIAGMRAAGFEEDAGQAAYAREIFRLTAVNEDRAGLEAMPQGCATCVTCDLGLDTTPDIGRTLDTLCRMVATNGHIVIVARNGELQKPSDAATGGMMPLLGGRQLQALTPPFLERQLSDRGLTVTLSLRGPARLEDPKFPVAHRDPFAGVPIWSARPGDFVVTAKRP